jgi:hypothetical protein
MEPPFSFQAVDEATDTFPEAPLLAYKGTASARWPRSSAIVHSKAHQPFELNILWAGSGFPLATSVGSFDRTGFQSKPLAKPTKADCSIDKEGCQISAAFVINHSF